ncbi:MAG: cystathionine beta-lyase [Pseudopedobacter saltans]|uniref:cysteine-S-conjugate beta-lyase n=1 Tax=Pseudopedobacter saltans TaxID=151895 RepID=A0A2W5EIV7_9SPHI|nr:MAG: cystathionine beta-lyase [Pseudopedobacter saltans]
MSYNFDEIIDRKNTNSQKWDAAKNDKILPMWVADMDFNAPIPVIEALQNVVTHGIFGYAKVPDKYFESIIGWFGSRYNFSIEKEWILHTIGVIPALSAIIKALTNVGDKVLIQEPVYNGFVSPISNNNCSKISSNLIYKNGKYEMDFDDLALKLGDPTVKLMLLCNPHNPAGRAWTKNELEKLGNLCIENNVLVIADEIHCDLVFNDNKHTPFATISEAFLNNSVTCTSPSKTFNLAGLQVANIFVSNETIRKKIHQALLQNAVHDISPFAIEALVAAYNDSENWLNALLPYLYTNYTLLKQFLSENFPQLYVLPLEATYLVWIDCSKLNVNVSEFNKKLYNEGNLWINEGKLYGESGLNFIRINIACPKAILIEGLNRLKKTINTLQ